MQMGFLTYLLFTIVAAIFTAYTLNMQKTTLAIGKRLAPDNPLLPTGFQDAITPQSQDRNNTTMFILLPVVLLWGFVLFKWYWVLLWFGLFFYVLTPLCSALFVPRAGSAHYVNQIRRSLVKRLNEYRQTGDKAREEALLEVLSRLDILQKVQG